MKRVWIVSLLLCRAAFADGEEPRLPVFREIAEQAGIRAKHSFGDFTLSNIVEGTGSGGVFFDYNGDGLLDLYLCNGRWTKDVNDNRGRELRGKLTNHLYRNNGNGSFTDVSKEAGVEGKSFACGASAADYDGDGDVDLYVLCYGANELYRNNGDGTFTDVSAKSGLADARWSLSATWFDHDGDGLLDVYVCNYLEYDGGKFRSFYAASGYPGPLSYHGQPDALYRNQGDGTFRDVTKECGLWNPEGRGMSATVADLNNDGRLDIYVCNDAMENNYYARQADGKYKDIGLETGTAFGEGGQGVSHMGPVVGDVDRDGRLDIYIPDMGYGTLLVNRGEYFEDRTAPSGLALVCGQYTGWGGLLLDYDNDGYLDVFVANGDAHHEYTEEAVLMRNSGKGGFVDVAKQSGDYFKQKFVSRGAAYGDFDNDGDMDIVVMNLNDQPRLLRNEGGTGNHWLTVVARLAGGKSDAIGARITVRSGELTQIHDLVPSVGYLSQVDPRAHFGLGKATKADAVEVRWPDGRVTPLKDVKADQFLTVVQEGLGTAPKAVPGTVRENPSDR